MVGKQTLFFLCDPRIHQSFCRRLLPVSVIVYCKSWRQSVSLCHTDFVFKVSHQHGVSSDLIHLYFVPCYHMVQPDAKDHGIPSWRRKNPECVNRRGSLSQLGGCLPDNLLAHIRKLKCQNQMNLSCGCCFLLVA